MTRLRRVLLDLIATPAIEVDDPSLRQAAVAVLLAPDPDQLLVIRRSEREGDPWSGHLALPGGMREATDSDLLHTALRETREETGLALDREWCRCTLDDLAPRTAVLPPVMVRPFVFELAGPLDAGVSGEVAHAEWVPLELLAREGTYRTLDIESHGQQFAAPGYQLGHGFMWGLTERIVTPLVRRWISAAR